MLSVIANKLPCPNCSVLQDLYIDGHLFNTCKACGCQYFIDKEKNTSTIEVKNPSRSSFSFVAIGSTGKYKARAFEIIGHIRSIDKNSISNEWLMLFSNGELLWLIESAFSYFVFDSKPIMLPSGFFNDKKVGSSISIELKDYFITELTKQVEFEAHGQLPKNCYNDEPYFRYEAVSLTTKDYVSICIFDVDNIEAYRGNAVTLKSLELSTFNDFKSWI